MICNHSCNVSRVSRHSASGSGGHAGELTIIRQAVSSCSNECTCVLPGAEDDVLAAEQHEPTVLALYVDISERFATTWSLPA
jgi:hypothetical protein